MSKRKWWERSSAVDDGALDLDDDGPEIVEVGDDDEDGDDWIDSFRFDQYKADRGLSSSDSIWRRYGDYGTTSSWLPRSSWSSSPFGQSLGVDYATAKRIEAAHKLVQGFVDTFALDNPLRARFSTNHEAVGGDKNERDVAISHRPLLDTTIDTSEAHSIMTAQAANAAARARYGGRASKVLKGAVEIAMGGALASGQQVERARELAAILDGYRIDSQFRHDYPGYEDVYSPAQRYIAKQLLGDRERFALEDFRGASIANAALNYADFTDWSGRESEREWWTDWADRYAHGGTVSFVEGVEEGLRHLDAELLPPPPDQDKGPSDDASETPDDDDQDQGDSSSGGGSDEQDDDEERDDDSGGGQGTSDSDGDQESDGGDSGQDGEQDDDDSQGSGGAGDGDGDEQDDGWEDDEPQQQDASQDGGRSHGGVALPTDLGEGVSTAGRANGQSQEIDPDKADSIAESAQALALGKDEKEIGEIYWTANGFKARGAYKVNAHPAANGYIRRAFSRSRTAHYASERGHVTGRIDNRSLPRIASDDYRLFAKRVAPSETRYRVWLLLDNSGSMGNGENSATAEAINLAASVALAVRHMPNVTLDVWAWTSRIRVMGTAFSAIRVYADGQPISAIGDMGACPQGGTPDAAVLSWATREIRKQCRPDETPVVIMASDGDGDLIHEAMWIDPETLARVRDNYGSAWIDKNRPVDLVDRVGDARKKGVKVLSVAIGNITEEGQRSIYGKGNYLEWKGSIQKMAKPLGDLLARVASNKIK